MTQPVQPVGYVPVDYMPTRPTSVTTLAIIGIVLAALTLIVCTPLGIVPYFVPAMEAQSPALGAIKSNTALFAFLIASVAAGAVAALLLLFASIGSLRLNKWARPGMIAYAFIFILLSVVTLVANFAFVFPITTSPEYLPPEAKQMASMMKNITYGGTACMTLVFQLYPAAILYFFTRQHVVDAFEKRITL